MSNVVDFPLPDRPITEEEVDKLHAEAFRDLEARISDCAIMALIAVQLAEPFVNTRDDKAEEALFAVCHVYEMLKKLKADYQAAFHGEQRLGAS
jgi:hypothetical protein